MNLQRPRTFTNWKSGFIGLLGVALLTFGAVRPASAAPLVVGDVIRLADSYGTTGGGEFSAQIVGTSPEIDFITFCMESNEYFTPGENLRVAGISQAAQSGGAGGGGVNGDPLDDRTAYFYTNFTNQTLSGYDFLGTGQERVNDANSLQRAFWYIEQEMGTTTLSQLDALDHQAYLWVTQADAAIAANWTNDGSVQVLNLMRNDGAGNYTVKAQDQIYYSVPEPGVAGLLMLGAVALMFMKRRGLATA